MNSTEMKSLLATCGGDTVKLFDVSSLESRDPCVLSYTPSPTFHVNCVKWNHTNLVVASAGDDKKISLWRKNGQSLGTIGTDAADDIEESISTINFSHKSSGYICSGGSGQVVRIWDLRRKRCIKWLKGHTDSISGAVYNCKDEHLASISVNGGLIIHNLASGTKATELKDPNSQVLRVLDYSKISRHQLVTAGDDGSVHLWDTTGRNPKVSWLKQHSAPASGLSFSPSNDKIIASVGLDKKLYTFDAGSRRPTFSTSFESPFSSLAFTDDGLKLAAGTTSGRVVFYDIRGKPQPWTVLCAYGNSEAVTSICWQRSKPVIVNESDCSADIALLGGALEDSILMPDPLSSLPKSHIPGSNVSGTQNSSRVSSSIDSFSFTAGSGRSISTTLNLSTSEETPIRSSLLTDGSLARLQAPKSYNFRDEMELFSPVVNVQPITPSLDKLLEERGVVKKDLDTKSSLLFPSRRFNLSKDIGTDPPPMFDWKSSSTSRQDDLRASPQRTSIPSSTSNSEEPSLITPPEAWGGDRLYDKYAHLQSINMPSHFATMVSNSSSSGLFYSGIQDIAQSTVESSSSLTVSTSVTHPHWRSKEISSQETYVGTSEHAPFSSAYLSGQSGSDSYGAALSIPTRFSNYAERISTAPLFSDGTSFSVDSPKSKKTGAETKEEMLTSIRSLSNVSSPHEAAVPPSMNGGILQVPKLPSQSDTPHGSSFTLQLFQRTLEETLSSSQKSIHEDMRNLHIEVLRQFHRQEMEMSSVMKVMLENQVELMKEVQSLKQDNQKLRDLL